MTHSQVTADELWDFLNAHANTGDILTAATPAGNHDYKDSVGLSLGHVYSLLKTVKLSTGDRLVQLRNPWAHEGYHGEWGDESDKWTPALRKEAGSTNNHDDGFFSEMSGKKSQQTWK